MEKEREELRKIIKLNAASNLEANDSMCRLQEDAVLMGIDILENKENFLMIADEVGIGKTFEALGIIFYCLTKNKNSNILIVAPNEAIAKKWEKDICRFAIRFIQYKD